MTDRSEFWHDVTLPLWLNNKDITNIDADLVERCRLAGMDQIAVRSALHFGDLELQYKRFRAKVATNA